MPDTLRYITLQSGQHREHSLKRVPFQSVEKVRPLSGFF